MNGKRNHLPEVAFFTQLKRKLEGKKNTFSLPWQGTHSLNTLHSQLSLTFIQTLWSAVAKVSPPRADVICSLAISVAHSKAKIPQLGCCLLLTSPTPPTPPGLAARRMSCWKKLSALWWSTLCQGHLSLKPKACFLPPMLSWCKGVTTQHTYPCTFRHCFETRYTMQYCQPAQSNFEQALKPNNNSLETF